MTKAIGIIDIIQIQKKTSEIRRYWAFPPIVTAPANPNEAAMILNDYMFQF
jgi:hypothetical protein